MANRRQLMLCISCGVGFLVPVSLVVVLQWRKTEPQERQKFVDLRSDAEKITVGMSYQDVTNLLGTPDLESDWLEHLPNWRVYFFDTDREYALGRKSKSHISVLIDLDSGVRTVDVYDPVFETCTGNKIDNTCEPINEKHHDRFAGPIIIGA